ncbi:MAG: hypothetical protein JNK58_02685 [Phycisphaerae bacterium]|nr:hypothetical protein [Phycisphaerae bacterium]
MAKTRSKKGKRELPETPTCNCILLCEDVEISQGKGKHTLHGVIGTIVVPGLPTVLSSFPNGYVAYVRVQNVHGHKMLEVSLEEAATREPVFMFKADLPAKKDPLDLYTVCVPVIPFVIERDGLYWFTAMCEGSILAQSPIRIVCTASRSPET